MLLVLSPAKTFDFENPPTVSTATMPGFLDSSRALIDVLRTYSMEDLAALMKMSPELADLNFRRYLTWKEDYAAPEAKQAIFAFKGDVFKGLDAYGMSGADLTFAQDHLRILSGLYGVLRPLDLMLPYRLEMGTKLPTEAGQNLYQFWGGAITGALNALLDAEENPVLVNLASLEYFKSVRKKELRAEVITPVFKDFKNGAYKVLGLYAKQARGMMAGYMIRHRLTDPEELKRFDGGGYAFNGELSTDREWVFTRGE